MHPSETWSTFTKTRPPWVMSLVKLELYTPGEDSHFPVRAQELQHQFLLKGKALGSRYLGQESPLSIKLLELKHQFLLKRKPFVWRVASLWLSAGRPKEHFIPSSLYLKRSEDWKEATEKEEILKLQIYIPVKGIAPLVARRIRNLQW